MLIDSNTPPTRQLTPAEARANLERLRVQRREDYAGLDRLLGRGNGYISRHLKRGVPQMLDEGDRLQLARYFGVSASLFGSEPDPIPDREFARPKLPPRRRRR